MTQLVVTLEDQAFLPNIRRILKSLQGVAKVSVKTDSIGSGPNYLRLSSRANELFKLHDGWDGPDSKAISRKLLLKFDEQVSRIDDAWLTDWTLFPEAHGYLYLDYSKDSTLAGITMTESQLTYFIKKEGTVEKGDGKKFSNSNLKSILKKVYE